MICQYLDFSIILYNFIQLPSLNYLIMAQADDSALKNLVFQLSNRQQSQRSSPKINKKDSNTQSFKQQNQQSNSIREAQSQNDLLAPKLVRDNQRSSSKILLKQKDRFQIKGIQKGMFNNQEESINQFKLANNSSNVQLIQKSQSLSHISKRKPVKLSPIKHTSGVELLSQKQLNKNSELAQMPKKMIERPLTLFPVRVKQIGNFHQFVKQAVPVSKKLLGILKRNRSGINNLFPQFSIHLNQELKFLALSKRKPFHLTSTYHFGTNTQPVQQRDEQYIGTLKSNFSGTQFNLYDNSNDERQIIATIIFGNQLTCKSVPREIQVYILCPFYRFSDLEGADTVNTHLNLKYLYQIGQNKQNRKILKFVNKKPIWDPERQQFCMDFHGKALYSSVKNMILVHSDNQHKEGFLMAKAGQDVFNFDVMFPLSPRIGLAIASASFDWKLATQ